MYTYINGEILQLRGEQALSMVVLILGSSLESVPGASVFGIPSGR